jgi:mannose-1-phosphate guanylyltransferase
MMPVLNHPFLEHTISYLKKYGVEDITLALSYLPEVIQDGLRNAGSPGVHLTYSIEDSPLGTAGAVKNAEPSLDSTFAVLNGDIFTDLDIASMLAFHRNKRAKATIALTWVDNPCTFGVVETASDGRVKRFTEKPSPGQITTNWINAGIYLLEPEVLSHVPQNSHCMFERELFPLLIELNEPVYGYPFRGYWVDMGTPEKYWRLNCDLLLAKVSSPLIQSASRDGIYGENDANIHSSAKIIGPAIIGNRCQIDSGAFIKGPVVMGADCHVEEQATLEGSILWPGVSIGKGANLKQCVVGSHAQIEGNGKVSNRVITLDDTKLQKMTLIRTG